MLDWLIIGGGLHGTHLSLVLSKRLGVDRDALRVLDPHPQPLAHWHQYVVNTGMRHLRSSSVHHLDIDPYSLRKFSLSPAGREVLSFKYPYHRPGTELFNRHCLSVIERHSLDSLRISGRATGIDISNSGVSVQTDNGAIEARRVMLAVGMGEQPCWPRWAEQLKNEGVRINHLYGPGFLLDELPAWNSLLVLGGGIGAAQAAVKLAGLRPGAVALLSRHAPRIHQFDSDPGWNGPRRLSPFLRENDIENRRRIVDSSRYRGSIPPDVNVELEWFVRSGKLELLHGEVRDASAVNGGSAALNISGALREFDRIVLASGFEKRRPGGEWLDRLVDEMELPVASCGYPVVDSSLRWHDRLYVCGPLAELELGPVARNISGARHAGHRLFKYLHR